MAQAAVHGYAAIGIADRNTLAGVVRAYDALNQMREQTDGALPKLLIGSRLVFVDGTPDILAYPIDRAAYGRLCRLLSDGKLRAPKGECLLSLRDLLKWQEGLLLVVMPPHPRRGETSIGASGKGLNDGLADKEDGPGSIPKEEFRPHIGAAPHQIEALLRHLASVAPDRVWLGAVQRCWATTRGTWRSGARSRAPRRCRSSRPTTRSIMRTTAVSCRTSSPASAKASR